MITAALVLAALAAQEPPRRIAVTFDDLPLGRSSAPVALQESVTVALLDAITRQKVPAIGFVNEAKLLDSAGGLDLRRARLLEAWLSAGLELGNHTFSHPDLHSTTLAEFERDVLRGEAVIRPLLAGVGRVPRFFRHPFLHTGRSVAVRDSLETFLAEHGYRVAPVTIDNGDYLFARAFDLARDRRDAREAERIAAEYLSYMQQVTAFYEQQSLAILGREIPQVLLLHASALNAATFDGLMILLRDRGYRAVPLDVALADPAYRSPDSYTGPAGISWLHRWALTRGMPGSTFAGEPEVPARISSP
jgi:peptidoglycan/xylan/chitin deacetylase (PgdA/CDA1 family)